MANRNLKGAVEFYALGFILLLGLLSAVLAHFYIANQLSKIKVDVEVSINAEDSGSWASSFLKAGNARTGHMEILGSTAAENYRDFIGKHIYKGPDSYPYSIEAVLEKWGSIEKQKRALALGNNIKLGSVADPQEKYIIELPVPGGEKAALKIEEG